MNGFVYLIRNGNLYKIGRTENLEQRVIANMINNDRTFIPENETAEEKNIENI